MKEKTFGESRQVLFEYEAVNRVLKRKGLIMRKIVHPSQRLIKIYIINADTNHTLVVGVARCHPNDKWDTQIGERIALADALSKLMGLPRRIRWE